MHISPEQFEVALTADNILMQGDLELLRAHCGCTNCSATAEQLRLILRYRDVVQVNGAFGKLGHRIAAYLHIDPSQRPDNTSRWWAVLATGQQADRGFVWTLRTELVTALSELGMLEGASQIYAEEVADGREYTEGAVRTITVNRYERDGDAREDCIRHYGPTCVVCGFSFLETYGELGRGFIHVHHLIELSLIRREYRVDPIADLRPVCPNCHVMIHRRKPALSIDEVREQLRLSMPTVCLRQR